MTRSMLRSIDVYKRQLLYGVTGSGKTLVFLKLIEQCLSLGRQALVLVPEDVYKRQGISAHRPDTCPAAWRLCWRCRYIL